MAGDQRPFSIINPAPPFGRPLGGNMVAKNKIHGRRIRQLLQQLHYRCLFSATGGKTTVNKICFSHRRKQKTGLFIL